MGTVNARLIGTAVPLEGVRNPYNLIERSLGWQLSRLFWVHC